MKKRSLRKKWSNFQKKKDYFWRKKGFTLAQKKMGYFGAKKGLLWRKKRVTLAQAVFVSY